MTAPMPKDNEVDEKVKPVAWIVTNGGESCEPWLEYEQSEVDALPAVCIAEPLYSAATVAELRADVADREAVIECKNIDIRERDRALHAASQRADAAERRVGELEAALRDLISVADPLALAPREYERIREQTARGTRISIDPFPLLKCRYEDVVDLTDGLKRARATLTGADPT